MFYATLTDVIASFTSSVKTVLSDFNGKIRRLTCYKNVNGNYILHVNMNDNDSKLIDFAIGKGLMIKSTMFPRKDIHKYTWVSLDGRYIVKTK